MIAFNCPAFIQTWCFKSKGHAAAAAAAAVVAAAARQRGRRASCSLRRVSVLTESLRGVGTVVYGRKFRERPGELTPRNLDHPVPVGFVDVGGRRALIYGNPLAWALLTPCSCSPPHWLQKKQAALLGCPLGLRAPPIFLLPCFCTAAASNGNIYLGRAYINICKILTYLGRKWPRASLPIFAA